MSESPLTRDVETAAASVRATVDRVLTLDAVMSSARRVERVVRLCLRGDLEAEHHDLLEQLGQLVYADGSLRSEEGETSLAERSRVEEINERLGELDAEMREASYTVRFRAMSETDFTAFDKQHNDKNGDRKDPVDYVNKLLVETAVEPKLTLGEVQILRDQLSASQIGAMFSAAFEACTTGGLDVPKLPSFWHSPKPRES